ncbi:MAG: FG-GAP-like repeat-containing protein [Candidatus Eisenbacteria bacterium]|nr:FG-GAP-like repeat-containing protein [Candidatus Eisenbacteria bacterium]
MAYFGFSVGTAGDVNGDGYSDVIVGAPNYANGQTNEGRAYVYHGSAGGLAATAAWTAESDQASADFGHSVGTAGDVNGDGYSDVIVGAYEYSNGQTREGRAYVYYGSAGGLAATAAWTAESDQANACFGYSVGTAGDVNGDGYSDVIVGAPYYAAGQPNYGRAFVYLGSAGGLAVSAGWTAVSGGSFGYSVGTAGDVNGDGYSDVIVGAYEYSNGQAYEGCAFVYLGSAGGLAVSAGWTAESDQAGAYFGRSVGTAGDVNGDGYSDVIVGAYAYEYSNGQAYVYHGSAGGLAATAGWIAQSDQASADFGRSVGTAGDVNGDGYSDVIVGAPSHSNGQTGEGRAYVYYGNEGDGLHRIARQARTDDSAPIALLGLSGSADGFLLKAVGRTPLGRGNVRLQCEVKPLGTPFNGSGLVTGSAYNTGIPGGGGSVVGLSKVVTGLTSNIMYHWRLRTLTDSPFFPRSPWFSLPYNCVTEADVRTGTVVGVEGGGAVPGALLLGRGAPNPFEALTHLGYTLPERGHVRLVVYDVAGRQVAVLRDGEEDAGQHMVNWDGKGARGTKLPAGVYFVQLNFGGHKEARKIVLTR